MPDSKPLVPPFTPETAALKVRAAEDGWNSRDPEKVSRVYTEGSKWRNRSEFLIGREEIVAFLTRKLQKELDYRLIKELSRSTATGSRFARLRIARCGRLMVPLLWERELGVRCERAHAPSLRLHQ